MFLLYLDKLYIEDEGCEGRNSGTSALLAITQVVGNEEAILSALLHELQALGPATDHTVQGELSGLATLY